MSENGLLVTFEGGEGSGKSTQAALLSRRLESEGRGVLQLREPGGTPLGEELRRLLLQRRSAIAAEAELLLFLAARAELVRDLIRPALDEGKVVVCDRFSDSTIAYQGYGRGLDLAAVRALDTFATGGLVPDLTVLLDLPVAAGRARKPGERDAIEAEGIAFHEHVRQGYLALAAEEPRRWLALDATLDADSIAAQVWDGFGRLKR